MPCNFFQISISLQALWISKTAWKKCICWFNGSNGTQNIWTNLTKLSRLDFKDFKGIINNISCGVNCLFVTKILNTLMKSFFFVFFVPGLAWRFTVLSTFGLFWKTLKLGHAGSQIRVNARTGYKLIERWLLLLLLTYSVYSCPPSSRSVAGTPPPQTSRSLPTGWRGTQQTDIQSNL